MNEGNIKLSETRDGDRTRACGITEVVRSATFGIRVVTHVEGCPMHCYAMHFLSLIWPNPISWVQVSEWVIGEASEDLNVISSISERSGNRPRNDSRALL